MKIFKELKKLGYKHYTEYTVEELDDLPLESKERIVEQALVLRWFREKYQLDSSIALVANGYGFYIHKNRNYTNKGESYGMYITYEEAELACLIKLIEIVKNK
jgi:hypothetical protein